MTDEYTIGRLAKAVGLSRSTLLYYDRLGLLRPLNRSESNYRLYSVDELERLRRICTYRQMGLPLKQIRALIEADNHDASTTTTMLDKHLKSLDREIASLRHQQRQVVLLLQQITSRTSSGERGKKRGPRQRAQSKALKVSEALQENDMITKDRWVEIMRAAGLSDEDMHNWHRQFERLEPEAHQEFLESLGIAADEICAIRQHFQA